MRLSHPCGELGRDAQSKLEKPRAPSSGGLAPPWTVVRCAKPAWLSPGARHSRRTYHLALCRTCEATIYIKATGHVAKLRRDLSV